MDASQLLGVPFVSHRLDGYGTSHLLAVAPLDPLIFLVERPVVPPTAIRGNSREAVVQPDVVPDRVSPALIFSLAIVGEVFLDVVVDPAGCEAFLWKAPHRHRDERHVRVRRLEVQVVAFVRVDVLVTGSAIRRRHGDKEQRTS